MRPTSWERVPQRWDAEGCRGTRLAVRSVLSRQKPRRPRQRSRGLADWLESTWKSLRIPRGCAQTRWSPRAGAIITRARPRRRLSSMRSSVRARPRYRYGRAPHAVNSAASSRSPTGHEGRRDDPGVQPRRARHVRRTGCHPTPGRPCLGGADHDDQVRVPLSRGPRHSILCRQGPTPMMCARCDMPILPGDRHDVETVDRASGPPVTIAVHSQPCRRSPQPTAPSGLGAQTR
jgi:hypothetical protein